MRTVFKLIFRIIQLAGLVFFGYWIYLKYFGTGLEFAVFSITMLPFIIGAIALGTLISAAFCITCIARSNKALHVYNVALMLMYVASIVYMIVITR